MKKHLLLIMLIMVLVACGKPKKTENTQEVGNKKSVKVQVVTKEILSSAVVGNGNVEPVAEASQTAPEVNVVKVYFRNGDRVKEGDLIIQLEDKTIKANYEKAKAALMIAQVNYDRNKKFSQTEELNQFEGVKAAMISAKEALDKAKKGAKSENIAISKANVTTAKKNYDQAKFNYDKNKKLYDEKLISELTFIQYETNYYQAKSGLESAQKSLELLQQGADEEDIRTLEANYNRAKSNYDLAQKNVGEKVWNNEIITSESNYLVAKSNYDLAQKEYDDLTVRAKISGIISNLNVKAFEKVKKDTVLFYVIEDKEMEVSIGLNASEIVQIARDSKAEVFIDDLNKKFEAKITEISPSADLATKKFMVKVKVANPEGIIKKGMYSKVSIYTKPKEMLVVPKNAVVVKDLYKYLFKIVDGKAKQIKVEIGNSTDTLQEILSKDIVQGDNIVVDGQYLLQDNDLIEEVK